MAVYTKLDKEKLKVIDNKIAEVAELKRQLSGMKERSDVLRTSLLQDMELMGLVGNGDSLTSEHLGVYIELVDTKQYRIDASPPPGKSTWDGHASRWRCLTSVSMSSSTLSSRGLQTNSTCRQGKGRSSSSQLIRVCSTTQ